MNQDTQVQSTEDVKLKRSIGFLPLVLLGIAYMSPICIFLYYGIITQMSVGMYALTLTITTVVMGLTAFSYSKMAKAFPAAGSVYTYVEKSINPHLGFVAGWGILADYMLLPMICYLSFGLYTNALIPAVPVWAWILLGIAVVTILNCRGIKLVATFNSIITIIPIIVLACGVVIIIAYVAGGGGAATFFDFGAFYNAENFSSTAVIMAAAILCCGFVGFDAISTMTEEAIHPEKDIPRAIILTCIGTGVIYIFIAYIMQLAWPEGWSEMTNPDTGILEFFTEIGKAWMSVALSIINILTALACCLSGQTAVARILYGMGRDGFLPKKVFGYLHPKYSTPIYNIFLTSAVGLCAIFFANNLSGAASLISFGALFGFAFVNLSVIVHFFIKQKKRDAAGIISYLVLPALGAITCVYLLFGLAAQAKILGAIWIAVGIIYLAFKTKFFRQLPPDLKI